jgi:hypothetical protein
MISYTSLSPRALQISVEGPVTREDVRDAFGRMEALLATTPQFDVLAEVKAGVHVELAAIGEELKHLGLVGRMVRALERIALVAEPAWVRTIGKIEAHLIPGVDYRVYKPEQMASARAFILWEG